MKAIHLIIIAFLMAPLAGFSQSDNGNTRVKKGERVYQKRTTQLKTEKDTSDVTAILKDSSNAETGPILNDNGSVSTTGTIDGRSSTGRPDADTATSYSVKRSKTTIKTVNPSRGDSTKRKKSKP